MTTRKPKSLNELILCVTAMKLENTQRPITTGKELSKTYGDLFDKLQENGYLHEGERELLMGKLLMRVVDLMEGGL